MLSSSLGYSRVTSFLGKALMEQNRFFRRSDPSKALGYSHQKIRFAKKWRRCVAVPFDRRARRPVPNRLAAISEAKILIPPGTPYTAARYRRIEILVFCCPTRPRLFFQLSESSESLGP